MKKPTHMYHDFALLLKIPIFKSDIFDDGSTVESVVNDLVFLLLLCGK